LNDKVRTISNASSFKSGTTTNSGGSAIGYAGLDSETRDKIINNLHPEICRISISGTGSCTALWHCGDNLTNCIDRSSEATLIQTGSTFCIWQLPYCEFSTWAGGQPATPTTTSSSSSSSSSGGGGGGGGGSTTKVTHTLNSINPGAASVVKLTSKDIGIKQIAISVVNTANNVKITIQKTSGQPASVTVSISGVVYQYIEITHENLSDNNIRSATIKFNVTKQWLNDNGFLPTEVDLSRFSSNAWQKLQTRILRESNDDVEYEADSPGLSVFAIVGEKPQASTTISEPVTTLPTPTEETIGEVPTGSEVGTTEGNIQTSAPIIIGGIAAVVAVALGFVYFRNMKKHRRSV